MQIFLVKTVLMHSVRATFTWKVQGGKIQKTKIKTKLLVRSKNSACGVRKMCLSQIFLKQECLQELNKLLKSLWIWAYYGFEVSAQRAKPERTSLLTLRSQIINTTNVLWRLILPAWQSTLNTRLQSIQQRQIYLEQGWNQEFIHQFIHLKLIH